MDTYVEECYEKGKPHSSGKAIVELFPLQVLGGQQRKTLKICTSEDQLL